MRRPANVRVRDLAELVFALGCGMALVRACHEGTPLGNYGPRYLAEPFLAGISVAGAALLAVETLRRRDRRSWGIGRWTWAVAGSVVILVLMEFWAVHCAYVWKAGRAISGYRLYRQTCGVCSTIFHQRVNWVLLASWFAFRRTGAFRDPEPDAREMTGRLLLATIIAWGFAYDILEVVARP